MQGCGSQSSNSSKHLTSPALYSIEWLAKASIQMARYIILLLYTVISSAINGLFGQMKRGISWLNTKPEHLRLMSNKKIAIQTQNAAQNKCIIHTSMN